MKHILMTALTCSFLFGCATQPEVKHLSSSFDSAQAEKMLKDGKNTIKGNAFWRQNGGGVVTCAGQTVQLIPATEYAKERMRYLYGSEYSGKNSYITRPTGVDWETIMERYYKFEPDYSEYHDLIKKTICDSSGHFSFEHISDGTFFVTAEVSWVVPTGRYGSIRDMQGGWLMSRVTLKGGETQEVIMAPR